MNLFEEAAQQRAALIEVIMVKGDKVITTRNIRTQSGKLLLKGTKGTVYQTMPLGYVIEAERKLWWVAPFEVRRR